MRSKNAFIFTALSTLILLIPMTTAATGLRPPVGKIKAPVTPTHPMSVTTTRRTSISATPICTRRGRPMPVWRARP